jgi:hypothetical protein
MRYGAWPRWLVVLAGAAFAGLVVLLALTLPTGRAVAVTTGVLVIVTTWYAWQTRRMAAEMESARAAQLRPHLALDVHKEQGAVFLRIVNAGVGPAMSIDVLLTSEPGTLVRIPFRTPVLAPRAGQVFVLHEGTGPTVADLKQLVKTHGVKRVNLTGVFVDALGVVHEANDTLDLETYSDAFYSRSLRVVPDDSIERIAEAVERISRRRDPLDKAT